MGPAARTEPHCASRVTRRRVGFQRERLSPRLSPAAAPRTRTRVPRTHGPRTRGGAGLGPLPLWEAEADALTQNGHATRPSHDNTPAGFRTPAPQTLSAPKPVR